MNINIQAIQELSPPILLMVFLNVIGWVLKRTPFPNNWIPLALLFLGGLTYPFIYDRGQVVLNVEYPLALVIIYGVCIGGASVGVFEATKTFSKKDDPMPAAPEVKG